MSCTIAYFTCCKLIAGLIGMPKAFKSCSNCKVQQAYTHTVISKTINSEL